MKQLIILFLFAAGILLTDKSLIDLQDIKKDKIAVYVDGAVEKEGEVELERYSSMQDLLELIQPVQDADLDSINKYMILKDKDYVHIPRKNDEILYISINYSDLAALSKLPGIGDKTAQKIIDYREENGLFQQTNELMNVKGIGNAKFEKIKDYITL